MEVLLFELTTLTKGALNIVAAILFVVSYVAFSWVAGYSIAIGVVKCLPEGMSAGIKSKNRGHKDPVDHQKKITKENNQTAVLSAVFYLYLTFAVCVWEGFGFGIMSGSVVRRIAILLLRSAAETLMVAGMLGVCIIISAHVVFRTINRAESRTKTPRDQ